MFIILLIVTFVILIFRSQKKWIFANVLKKTAAVHNAKVKKEKLAMFEQLKTLKSTDPELRAQNKIRILELGAGTGANFDFYPKNCHLVIVEPNAFFEKIFREAAAKYPGITIEKYVTKPGEDIKDGDIKFGSFDVVVSTLVCCSVANLPAIYSLIKSALADGGRYIFMDHILAPSPGWLNSIQRFFDKSGIWPALFDGCYLSRDLDKRIKKVGFTKVETNNFYVDTSGIFMPIWKCVQLHTYGTAFK